MKRESNTMTRKAEQEFERRMEAFFSEIFPEHAQCGGSCRGHQLPDMAKWFLKELGYPADLKSLTIAARSWFERIDLDASGSIDRFKVLMRTCAHTHSYTLTHIWWERQNRHIRIHVCAAHTYTHIHELTRTHARITHTCMRVRTGWNLQRNSQESASKHLQYPRCGNITISIKTTRWM